MKLVRVGAAVLNQTPLDWDGNKERIVGAIRQAQSEGVSVLCLPELCLTGYGCEDAFHGADVHRLALQVLQEILPSTRGIIVSLGLPLMFNSAVFNTAVLAVDGKIAGFAAKRFLAGDGIHYEPRWFKPWPEGMLSRILIGGTEYPLGDLFFECGGIRIGFEICEDAWVARRPGSGLSLHAVDIILNPSASHFAFHKFEVRKRFVVEGSRAFGVTYVYSNLLGNEGGRVIYDGGALIASGGELVARGPRFSFDDFALSWADIDIDATRTMRARTGSFTPELEPAAEQVAVSFSFPELRPQAREVRRAAWEESASIKEEELARAVALGLFDYLRKSRTDGFVVSLSGGADSSACVCLVAVMVHLALGELGLARLLLKLPKRIEPGAVKSARDLMGELLVCLYQGTKNSSAVTHQAAEAVARGVGAKFCAFAVDHLVDGYLALAGDQLKRELTWERDDAALQNIQARVRAPAAWLIANLRNSLLLVTSNRSEAAVGYATMDGDTAGSLSPLGGVDKAFLRRWNQWLERDGLDGKFRVPELSYVNSQQPTAELRPPEYAQTDEKDLMPYEVLDQIERAAILDRQSPLEIFLRLKPLFLQYPDAEFALWIERFFTLWCRNQWKRERYAPSFHLDDESLDPKTWCRFPILSGGYKRELAELRAHITEARR